MAQDQTQASFYDFMHGKYLLKRLFGIDLQEDDYVEDAYRVWRDIGNIAVATHAFEGIVGTDNVIVLPCNCEFIEAVTTGPYRQDNEGDLVIWYDTSTNVINPNSFLPDIKLDESYLLSPITHTQLHPQGVFIDYELFNKGGAKYMRFNEKYAGSKLTVMYRGIIMDDDGNPCITRKESEAIAYKIALIETQLEAYKGDPLKIKLLGMIKGQSDIKMQAAKIPEYLSQNFIDQLLAAQTRYDRKVFNSSYKTER